MSETAVERRLREMAEAPVDCSCSECMAGVRDDRAAIDAGREALELLREWEDVESWGEAPPLGWQLRVRALLARCEGEK